MLHGIWNLFLALIGRDADDQGDGEHRFVPSPLDLSVRVGHGGQDDDIQRELSKIDERARDLEDPHRDG